MSNPSTPTRREFLMGCAGCAVAMSAAGCTAVNPAPLVDADAEGATAVGGYLEKPGDQLKVRLPGVSDPVLVWRTAQGYGAASIVCTHLGSEVHFNAAEGTLDCPSHGSRYDAGGKVIHGPAKKSLTPYRATVEGNRLRVRPA